MADIGKRDPRFLNAWSKAEVTSAFDHALTMTFVSSLTVYEETKVCKPNEFEFMVKITPLTDKPLILLISYFLRKVSGKTSEMKRLLQSKIAFPSLQKPYHEINM